MTLIEPGRSRLLIVVGLVLFAFGTWMQIVTDNLRTPWAMLFNGAWLVFLLAVIALNLVMALRTLGAASKRPARFAVAGRRFVAPGLLSTGFMAMMLLVLLSNTIADTVNEWRDPTGQIWVIFLTAMTAVMVPIVVLYLLVAWRGIRLELSPAGITWQTPIFRRLIPWSALAPGGPPRPHPEAKKLELAVVQPGLVTQKGLAVGAGTKDRPTIPMQLNIHPWFLADAIRWYAEHPEHRDAIGTQQEHDRLTTLGG
ncbi:MAG TPA: hypothetical protein DGG94_20565 [Micromonosporaceae bacterium]|nr:hypothetical protein [Micromonosporaceae bacterium]